MYTDQLNVTLQSQGSKTWTQFNKPAHNNTSLRFRDAKNIFTYSITQPQRTLPLTDDSGTFRVA
jgi:hypothetical protein